MHAFVLAGGAARGAYGAGVMRYIFTELPKNLGWTPWPDLVSGTSVGALNGVFAACHNEEAIHYISDLWRNLSIEHVYRLRAFRAMGSLVWALRSTEPFFMLDARPLRHLVDNAFRILHSVPRLIRACVRRSTFRRPISRQDSIHCLSTPKIMDV